MLGGETDSVGPPLRGEAPAGLSRLETPLAWGRGRRWQGGGERWTWRSDWEAVAVTQTLVAPSMNKCPRAPECNTGQPLRGEGMGGLHFFFELSCGS